MSAPGSASMPAPREQRYFELSTHVSRPPVRSIRVDTKKWAGLQNVRGAKPQKKRGCRMRVTAWMLASIFGLVCLPAAAQDGSEDRLVVVFPEDNLYVWWHGPGCGPLTMVAHGSSADALLHLSKVNPVKSLFEYFGYPEDDDVEGILDERDDICIAEARVLLADHPEYASSRIPLNYELGRWAPEPDTDSEESINLNLTECSSYNAWADAHQGGAWYYENNDNAVNGDQVVYHNSDTWASSWFCLLDTNPEARTVRHEIYQRDWPWTPYYYVGIDAYVDGSDDTSGAILVFNDWLHDYAFRRHEVSTGITSYRRRWAVY